MKCLLSSLMALLFLSGQTVFAYEIQFIPEDMELVDTKEVTYTDKSGNTEPEYIIELFKTSLNTLKKECIPGQINSKSVELKYEVDKATGYVKVYGKAACVTSTAGIAL